MRFKEFGGIYPLGISNLRGYCIKNKVSKVNEK